MDNQCLYGYDCVDGKCVKESGVSQLDKYFQKLNYLKTETDMMSWEIAISFI